MFRTKSFLSIAPLLIALTSAIACGSLTARQNDPKPLIVFDGDNIGTDAKGWADPADKSTVTAQDNEVRTAGHKTVAFHGKGQGWMGCGWNWFGFSPSATGTDTTPFKNLTFWAKLAGAKKPGMLGAVLRSNEKEKERAESRSCSLFKYCPDLSDGNWHRIQIPLADLFNGTQTNRAKAWELMIGCWAQEDADFTLYIDQIGFEGKGEAPPEATAAPLPKEIDAAEPDIRYVGRWDLTDPHAPRASWTCSSIVARFQGTAINAKFKGGGYYQVVVDGNPTRMIGPRGDTGVYSLASGLQPGPHTVELVRRNEGNYVDPIVFSGIQLERSGRLLPLVSRGNRRILIVGDSISCGYGNEAQINEGNPLDKENGYMTYGAIAGRKLRAEVEIVAWSGRKLYPNNTMVELYDRTLAMSDSPKADLKGWVPGVVLIDLGTNDFGDRNHLPDQAGWIDAYKAFIRTIRQTAPDAYIFVASGPMGTAPEWEAWAHTVVDDLHKAGDLKVAYLAFPTQDVQKDGVGGDWHPNLITHAKMADLLVSEIGKAVGWTPVANRK